MKDGHSRRNCGLQSVAQVPWALACCHTQMHVNAKDRDARAVYPHGFKRGAPARRQSEVLRAVAERLGIADDEDLLTKLVGVEEAPDRIIKNDQQGVHRWSSSSAGTAPPPVTRPRGVGPPERGEHDGQEGGSDDRHGRPAPDRFSTVFGATFGDSLPPSPSAPSNHRSG